MVLEGEFQRGHMTKRVGRGAYMVQCVGFATHILELKKN
jgi:hypothetical protein